MSQRHHTSKKLFVYKPVSAQAGFRTGYQVIEKEDEFLMGIKKIMTPLIVLVQALVLLSCGNLLNDSMLDKSENSDGGVVFTELNRSFSDSGNILIEKSSDSGYLMAGSVLDGSTADSANIWFSLTDRKGKSAKEGVLASSYNDSVRGIRILDSDNYMIFADRYYDDGDIDFIIIYMNRYKGILWDYCLGDSMKNRVYDMTVSNDGNLLIAGMSYYKESGQMYYIPFMIKMDMNGNIIWKKNYNTLLYYLMPLSITSIGSDEYIVSGNCLSSSAGKFRTFFSRINGSGDLLSSVYINAISKHSLLVGVSKTSVGGFTGIIYVRGTSGSDLLVFADYDSSLNLTATKEFSFSGFNLRGKYIRGLNGDIIIAGLLDASAGNGLYFLRFSSNGIIKSLETKYYDEIKYDLADMYFSSVEVDDGILYLCRYTDTGYDPGVEGWFMDRFRFSQQPSYVSKSNSAVRVSPANSEIYETGEVILEEGSSDLYEKGGTELILLPQ